MIKQLFLLFFLTSYASAHPVIYKGGTVFSTSNMPGLSENYLMYSFKPNWSSGASYWRFSNDNKNTELGLAKLNHLLKRWNGTDYQANIYLHGGFGVMDSEIQKNGTEETYMAGVDADWETRTLYASLKHYEFHSPDLSSILMTQGRVGFSPKLSDFNELQTWVMLQGMYTPVVDRTLMITPLLRFFYHNVLWEMGSSFRGEWMFNFMVHY